MKEIDLRKEQNGRSIFTARKELKECNIFITENEAIELWIKLISGDKP